MFAAPVDEGTMGCAGRLVTFDERWRAMHPFSFPGYPPRGVRSFFAGFGFPEAAFSRIFNN